jgi:hypothetical protein
MLPNPIRVGTASTRTVVGDPQAIERIGFVNAFPPVVVAGWMSEVQGERLKAEREIGVEQPAGQLTRKQIRALVASLKDIAAVLATADPKLKAEVYEELGITVKYDPTRRLVSVESRPPSACTTVSVGGGT